MGSAVRGPSNALTTGYVVIAATPQVAAAIPASHTHPGCTAKNRRLAITAALKPASNAAIQGGKWL